MPFNSYVFLFAFLPIVLASIYWLRALQAFGLAQLGIIALSIFFYGWWDWRFVALLTASALFNWIIGGSLSRARNARRASALLAVGISINLAVLAFFKYGLFFLDLIRSRWI